MAKDSKQVIFSVHGMTICDYFDGLPISPELNVMGDLSLPVTAESEAIFGTGLFPVADQPLTLKCEGEIELREFPEELAEYLVAGVGATVAAEAAGSVIALANYKGTSTMSATTGIATVGLKTGKTTELKAGVYVVKAVTASTVDVYACSSMDLKKGTDLVVVDDTMKVTATPLSITTGTAIEIPNLGVELTGGSGTIALVAGDTADFEIYPPHAGVQTITLGQADAEFKAVALVISVRKRTTGELAYIRCPNAHALGLPFGAPEKGWASGKVDLKISTHDAKGYAIRYTGIKGTSV